MADITEEWVSTPIVRRAIEQAKEPTALAIIEKLLEILNDIEARFPGVRFTELFDHTASLPPRQLLGTLRRAGVADRVIDQVLGRSEFAERYPDIGDTEFALVAQGYTTRQFAERGWGHSQARQLARIGTPLTDLDRQILIMLFDGASQREISNRFGCDTRTIKIAYRKHRYQLWRERNAN